MMRERFICGAAVCLLALGCSGSEGRSDEENVGPEGPAGPQGEQGEQGPQGSQGETGATGPQGIAGPQGETGATGPQGETGATGPQGIAGPQGETGATGAQGPQGPAGVDGLPVEWLGELDAPPPSPSVNDGYYDTVAGASYVFDGVDWQIIAQDGADGSQGLQGEQGVQGIQGPQGPAGTNGTNGVDGVDGTDGADGPAGPPGPQGPSGPPGSGALGEIDWGFAGFTVATYTGNMGGRPVAHAACAAEFPGAHLCHAAEYVLSNSASPIPVGGAWIDPSVDQDDGFVVGGAAMFGRWNSYEGTCDTWSHGGTSYTGLMLGASGELSTTYSCNTARPLACCNGASSATFAGFTAAMAPMTGRPSMHAACVAEYPGSHMCHAAEYVGAVSADPIPAGGAWIEPSITLTGAFTVGGAPAFGRWVSYEGTCDSWVHTGTSYTGLMLSGTGEMSTTYSCNVARPIACCTF
jgi:hypothetical protein